jgi:two-component system phosphate regulon sensor histidine kinase PhoR
MSVFWPVLSIILLVLAAGIHLRWRAIDQRRRQAAAAERDRMEQAHRVDRAEILSHQSALLNSMAEGILLLDLQGKIRLTNPAFNAAFQLTGSIENRSFLEVVRLPELSELVARAARKEPVLSHELRLPAKESWLSVNASPVIDSSGSVQGTVLVFHDVTRLKKLEGARRDFVANVSHELRTPLSLIKGYVETLLNGAKDQPEVAEKFLRTIDRNAERLRLLMEDLLTVSQLESGGLQMEFRPVALLPLCRKICEDFRPRAAGRKATLNADLPELTVRADLHRLEQVLSNLVDNAIKYGREGGAVQITARALPETNQVEVAVVDNGPGIPPESLDRVFERFYRVDKGRSRDQGGTGLGLSIVKHIVLSHGGRIWVESKPGQGAAFRFTLPVGK